MVILFGAQTKQKRGWWRFNPLSWIAPKTSSLHFLEDARPVRASTASRSVEAGFDRLIEEMIDRRAIEDRFVTDEDVYICLVREMLSDPKARRAARALLAPLLLLLRLVQSAVQEPQLHECRFTLRKEFVGPVLCEFDGSAVDERNIPDRPECVEEVAAVMRHAPSPWPSQAGTRATSLLGVNVPLGRRCLSRPGDLKTIGQFVRWRNHKATLALAREFKGFSTEERNPDEELANLVAEKDDGDGVAAHSRRPGGTVLAAPRFNIVGLSPRSNHPAQIHATDSRKGSHVCQLLALRDHDADLETLSRVQGLSRPALRCTLLLCGLSCLHTSR
jgi:hypothetical protein